MDSAEDIWKEHLRTLGEYIKAQRQMNQLTQRELARLADLSDTYMSQLERGLHEPSIRVLKSLAESLGIRPDQLIMYASGLPTTKPTSTPRKRSDTTHASRRRNGGRWAAFCVATSMTTSREDRLTDQADQIAVSPSSTTSSVPVMKLAPSESRKQMGAASSVGVGGTLAACWPYRNLGALPPPSLPARRRAARSFRCAPVPERPC